MRRIISEPKADDSNRGAMIMETGIHFVTFDRMMEIVRRAFPKIHRYGGDLGGEPILIMRFLQDGDRMRRLANELAALDFAYARETKAAFEIIGAAAKRLAAAEKLLVETVRGDLAIVPSRALTPE